MGIAGIVIAIAALVVSAISLVLAKRSTEAAEEANRIAQLHAPPEVTFKLEREPNGHYILRNTGTKTATGVTVRHEDLGSVAIEVPTNATVAAGDFTPLELWPMDGPQNGIPGHINVTWDGYKGWAKVTVPKI